MEHFPKLKAIYNLRKNIQYANTHNDTNQWYANIQNKTINKHSHTKHGKSTCIQDHAHTYKSYLVSQQPAHPALHPAAPAQPPGTGDPCLLQSAPAEILSVNAALEVGALSAHLSAISICSVQGSSKHPYEQNIIICVPITEYDNDKKHPTVTLKNKGGDFSVWVQKGTIHTIHYKIYPFESRWVQKGIISHCA